MPVPGQAEMCLNFDRAEKLLPFGDPENRHFCAVHGMTW